MSMWAVNRKETLAKTVFKIEKRIVGIVCLFFWSLITLH